MAVILTAVLVNADTVVCVPFTWQDATWCPTFRAANGCDNVQQSGSNSSVPFYPSQVTNTGASNYISLMMNGAATKTGAFNTQTSNTWSTPATLSEQINLPCNSAGKIENWPAFWLVTTGGWPAGGEIDVMEGLDGVAAWHYHYLNSAGASSSVGGAEPGFSGCGLHTYAVSWTAAAITFYYDGTLVGQVTPSEIGVPLASGPMYVINDYAASPIYGGPTTGGVRMQILNFASAGNAVNSGGPLG